jgi:hypothetical protein
VQISVQVQPSAIPALRGSEPPSTEVQDLRSRLEELGVELQPVHPNVDDPLLAPHFTVEAPDDEELAAGLLAVLTESPVVEAAYAKPPDELP